LKKCPVGIQPDVIMFTGLIDSLCKEGKTGKAARVKGMMVERGMEPNAVTYDVLINSLCKEGWVREAMTLKNEMVALVPGAGRWAAWDLSKRVLVTRVKSPGWFSTSVLPWSKWQDLC